MDLCCMPPEQTVMLATALALDLSCGKSAEEILALRNLLVQVGQTLVTIAGQMQCREKHCKERG